MSLETTIHVLLATTVVPSPVVSRDKGGETALRIRKYHEDILSVSIQLTGGIGRIVR
jgi:hypothetical protein